jgi:hypothetical protein
MSDEDTIAAIALRLGKALLKARDERIKAKPRRPW